MRLPRNEIGADLLVLKKSQLLYPADDDPASRRDRMASLRRQLRGRSSRQSERRIDAIPFGSDRPPRKRSRLLITDHDATSGCFPGDDEITMVGSNAPWSSSGDWLARRHPASRLLAITHFKINFIFINGNSYFLLHILVADIKMFSKC